jgi:lysophospholipid acyltransferase (LPLAT)-like uncharacterized protein
MSGAALQPVKLALAPIGWRLLAATLRVNRCAAFPLGEASPVIFACLHRDIIPAILFVRPARPYLLISKSPDGQLLIRCLARDGFGFVRGATGEDGGPAFVQLLRALRAGRHLGLAVDGPRGPYGAVHDGVLQLARRAGAPILPLVAAARRKAVLATWDRTVVPYPLSRVSVHTGSPLSIPADAGEEELEEARRRLRAFFDPSLPNGCA